MQTWFGAARSNCLAAFLLVPLFPVPKREHLSLSIGLIALLDDMAAIAKLAAASVDDAAALSAKAGIKAAGVVVDDAAITPRYVLGFDARRELPIVGKIAMG